MILYEPRAQFLPFHYRDQRWACIVAHRRAGKTVACINELLTRALATRKENGRYAYVAPFYKQAKTIAWEYLKRYGQPIIRKINESELWVELINGSRIYLFGADNPDALRGLYLDGVVLDEYADMRPSVWGAIIRPLLADRKGWAIFIGTPKGHNAFYQIHKLAKEDSGWFSLVLRASESKLLADEELEDARKTMTEDQYEQEFECSFEAAILGAVYGKWLTKIEKNGQIRENVYDASLEVHTAWDLGFDDATAIWFWQVVHNEIRLIDYYECSGESIEHYCSILKQRGYKYGKHFVPHDAAHKLFAAGGRSIVDQAMKLGIKMHVIPATSQQNGIEAARKTLEISWFDTKCEEGIEALKQYQFEYDEEKKIFKNKPRHDWTSHAADAYEIIGQVWRNPKQLEPETKPRFLNDMTFDELCKSGAKPHGYERI
jgi:phage terminase large subunit